MTRAEGVYLRVLTPGRSEVSAGPSMGCRHCENWLPEPPVTATEEDSETSTQTNPNWVIKDGEQDDANGDAEYQTYPGGYGLPALTSH